MLGFNQITLIGHCGKDPEMNYTPAGKAVTKFSVAVSEYKGKDATTNKALYESQWFNIVAWNTTAEAANRILYKGAPCFVQGRLVQRKYTDNAGNQRTAIDVVASTINLLAKVPEAEAAADTSDPLGDLEDHPF